MAHNSNRLEYVLSVCNKFPTDAEFADYIGVSPVTVSNWKCGKKVPSSGIVRLLQLLEFIQQSGLEIPASYE
jgi:transcriptional regulator with XRE-family HTH domain